MKLNLGSGKDYREDCINIDIRNNIKADKHWDIRNLQYEDNMVSSIVAQDVLEHFKSPVKVLKEWYRVLNLGGELVVRVPNWEKISKPNFWKNRPFDKCENKVLGGQKNKYDHHKSLFTAEILKKRLNKAGFTDIRIKRFDKPPLHWHLGAKAIKR